MTIAAETRASSYFFIPQGSSQAKGPDGDLELGVDLVGEHTDEVFIRNVNYMGVSIVFSDFVMYPVHLNEIRYSHR